MEWLEPTGIENVVFWATILTGKANAMINSVFAFMVMVVDGRVY